MQINPLRPLSAHSPPNLDAGTDGPYRRLFVKKVAIEHHQPGGPAGMQITTIGPDVAKHVFQVHGSDTAGNCRSEAPTLTQSNGRVRCGPTFKSGKNDAADVAAICEVLSRSSMRFVPIKAHEQQAVLTIPASHSLLAMITSASLG